MAPNMNPQRNNCLHGDYAKGERLLGKCYSSLLETFWKLVTDKDNEGEEEEESESLAKTEPKAKEKTTT